MSKLKSDVIAQELGGLEFRRQEIAVDLAAAQADLAQRREGLVSGTSNVGEVTAAQATYTALSEALGTLDGRIEATGDRLQSARQEEAAANRASRLQEIEKEREKSFVALHEAQKAANDALTVHIQAMTDAMHEWSALGKEARQLVSEGAQSPSHRTIADTFPWSKTDVPFYVEAIFSRSSDLVILPSKRNSGRIFKPAKICDGHGNGRLRISSLPPISRRRDAKRR